MTEAPSELVPALTSAPSLVAAAHVTPDADALGSMLALAAGVRQCTGRDVPCALPPGSVSMRLQFLVDWAQPLLASADACRDAALLAVCDTAKARRTNLPDGLNHAVEGRAVVNIDHHASNTRFGTINWIDDSASSTAELIYRLFVSAGWDIVPTVASLLYAGIITDTMGFTLPNTSHSALAAGAELVRLGADVPRIGQQMFRAESQSEFNLRRVIYDNTRVSASGRIAFSTANHNEIARAGCGPADVDDQVEIPRSLVGPRLAVLFTEGNPGKIRMNLRSEGDISVLNLALQIGGGGHHAAAGAIIDGTIEEAVAKVIPLAEGYLDQVAGR